VKLPSLVRRRHEGLKATLYFNSRLFNRLAGLGTHDSGKLSEVAPDPVCNRKQQIGPLVIRPFAHFVEPALRRGYSPFEQLRASVWHNADRRTVIRQPNYVVSFCVDPLAGDKIPISWS
jgi:hypothetical protein